MWFAIEMKGIYLPTLESPAITAKFLWGVLNRKYFVTKKKEITPGTLLKKASKLPLLDELSSIIGKDDLDFDDKCMPNKLWMINVIKCLEPNNALFKKLSNPSSTMQVTQE